MNADIDPWAEDADYPACEWQAAVANDDTRSGYVDWVVSSREADSHDDAEIAGATRRFFARVRPDFGWDIAERLSCTEVLLLADLHRSVGINPGPMLAAHNAACPDH